MTIVELIDVHDGFRIITKQINTLNKVKLLWIISLVTFFLSALLDNLTTTIVMATLIRKLIHESRTCGSWVDLSLSRRMPVVPGHPLVM